MEVTLMLISFECYVLQNEIWSNNSVLYEKHFRLVFDSMLETGNQFQALLFFIKMTIKQDLAIFNS